MGWENRNRPSSSSLQQLSSYFLPAAKHLSPVGAWTMAALWILGTGPTGHGPVACMLYPGAMNSVRNRSPDA